MLRGGKEEEEEEGRKKTRMMEWSSVLERLATLFPSNSTQFDSAERRKGRRRSSRALLPFPPLLSSPLTSLPSPRLLLLLARQSSTSVPCLVPSPQKPHISDERHRERKKAGDCIRRAKLYTRHPRAIALKGRRPCGRHLQRMDGRRHRQVSRLALEQNYCTLGDYSFTRLKLI